jgi:hypothetical protein
MILLKRRRRFLPLEGEALPFYGEEGVTLAEKEELEIQEFLAKLDIWLKLVNKEIQISPFKK